MAGLGSNGPKVVSPLTSHCTTPGSRIFPAGKVVPRITRATCGAIASSLPTPFWTEATAPSANACAVAAIAASVCIAFVATIPKSHAGSSDASLVARMPVACTSPAPVRRRPALVDRVDVRLGEVVRPHLDVLERREVRGKERPHGPTTDDAHPHAGLLRGSRSSRPPVIPDGRRISISAISAPSITSRDPSGRLT